MSQANELHRLVLSNLRVLERAPAIAEEIDGAVMSAVQSKVEDWTAGQSGWRGIFDYMDDQLTIQPASWGDNGEEGKDFLYNAYFHFSYEGVDHFFYNTSAMTGDVEQRFGVFFGVNEAAVTRTQGRAAKAHWAAFLAERFADSSLRAEGFEINDKVHLFLPIRVDAKALADAYPDDLDEALAPLEQALAKILKAKPQLDAILKAAMSRKF